MKRVIRQGRRPIQPPDSHPILGFHKIGTGTHTLCIRDSQSPPDSKKKPEGAAFAEIHIIISAPGITPANAPDGAAMIRMESRPIFTIDYTPHIQPPDAAAPEWPIQPLIATIFARWRTATG